jgi:hypothetical protein
MGHGLARIGALIDDEAIAGVGYTLLLGELGGDGEELAQQRGVALVGASDARKVFDGNDEHVDWPLRIDVAEGHDFLITVKDL